MTCAHDPRCPGWPKNQSCPETKPAASAVPDLLRASADELRAKRDRKAAQKVGFEQNIRELVKGMGDAILEDPRKFGPSKDVDPAELLNGTIAIQAHVLAGRIERDQVVAHLGLAACRLMSLALWFAGEWPDLEKEKR